MKKLISVLLLLGLLAGLCCGAAFADDDRGELLYGEWRELEPIHNGRSAPFYPDKKVASCTDLIVRLYVEEYTGAPFGNWYLYAKDLDGKWDHIADLKLDKSLADGHIEQYDLHFKKPVAFQALAFCMRDKGSIYTVQIDADFYLKTGEFDNTPETTPMPDSVKGQKLAGEWSEDMLQLRFYYKSAPFILEKKVASCTDLVMTLRVKELTGVPYGAWYLYAQGYDDKWEHIAEFEFDRSMVEDSVKDYEFHFKKPVAFKALALSVRDNGAVYSLDIDCDFFLKTGEIDNTPEPTPMPASAKGPQLAGEWSEDMLQLRFYYKSAPFILEKKVASCTDLVMTLRVKELSGYPYGVWYLYALGYDDQWSHIAEFEFDKSMVEDSVKDYEFHFKKPVAFKALALSVRDNGAVYSLDIDAGFFLKSGELDNTPEVTPMPAAAKGKALTGAWGELEPIHNGRSSPFVLDKEVTGCTDLIMTLNIDEYTGYPFGNWYLYARDKDGNWNALTDFKLDKAMGDGHVEDYVFHFKKPVSFKALALCMKDKGAEYRLDWTVDFFDNTP